MSNELLINHPKSNNSEDMSNKQIEEMARLMCANYDGESGLCGDGLICDHDCWAFREATALYNAGYRKQSEGEWIEAYRDWDFPPYFYTDYTCSVCGSREQNKRNFCPNCGAKMKGGEE